MRAEMVDRVLWIACAAAGIAGAISTFLHRPVVTGDILHVLAYGIALYFWIKVLGDHPPGSTMRLAWLMMAWSSAMAIVRHIFAITTYYTGWNSTMLHTLVSLRQIPIVLSLVFLTAGLVALWSSFAAVGMGARFRRTDLLWVACIVAIVPFILSSRENMADSRSVYPLIRSLQSASPILLAVPAFLAIALHRIRQEMGGGHFALALRLMIVFLIARLFSLLIGTSELHDSRWLAAISQGGFWAAQWLFPLAALERWKLTLAARAMEKRYESDPHAEIETLSGALLSSKI